MEQKKVLVTGGTGFIGSHVVERLVRLNAVVTVLDHVKPSVSESLLQLNQSIRVIDGDCGNMADALEACEGQQVVFNLAAHVGGIEYNRSHHGSMLVKNLGIGTTVIEAARIMKVERFLVVSSACVYPHNVQIPTPESEGFREEPEPTNAGYGWSKRMAELIGKYYAEEYGMNVGIVRPYNAYGPRDHFDVNRSHVIPSLIRRVSLRENPLHVWGSGIQTRAFLYVEDLAEGMVLAIEKYPIPEPLNLGSDEEVSIRELVRKIIKYSNVKVNVKFDQTKPDGSPRRNSDNTKAKEKIGFNPSTTLDNGLQRTIEWYNKNYKTK